MIVTITNLTDHSLFVEWFRFGPLSPGESDTKKFTPEEVYQIADKLKTLSDLGKISVDVADDPTILDAVEMATVVEASTLTLANAGSVPNAKGASYSGNTLTLQPADATNPGLLTAGAQTIGGSKTFTGAITASNLSGTNTGDGVTTADMTIYVDAAGNDTTGDGSVGAPYLTIQKAFDIIPKRVRHLVTINVGAGNFAGWNCQGFTVDNAVVNAQAGIAVQGTYALATMAGSGLNTGTLTSVTAGSTSSPLTFTVLNDTNNNLTVNDAKGKFIHILSGTGIGTIIPILSNTATGMTIPATTATSATGATYRIIDCTSIITSAVRGIANVVNSTSQSVPNGLLACAHYLDNSTTKSTSQSSSVAFRIEGIKFSNTTSGITGVVNVAGTPNLTVMRCMFTTAGATNQFATNFFGPGTYNITNSSMICTVNGGGFASCNGGAIVALTSNLIDTSVGAFDAVRISGTGTQVQVSVCKILGGTASGAILFTNANLCQLTSIFNQISGLGSSSGSGIRCRNTNGAYGGNMIIVSLTNISSFDVGMHVWGPHHANITSLYGSSINTYCVWAAKGAKVQIDSTSDIAVTTADSTHNALAVELAPNALFTLAQLRATVDRCLQGHLQTIIYDENNS